MEDFSREMKRLSSVADPVFPLVDFVARSHSKVVVMEQKRREIRRFGERSTTQVLVSLTRAFKRLCRIWWLT